MQRFPITQTGLSKNSADSPGRAAVVRIVLRAGRDRTSALGSPVGSGADQPVLNALMIPFTVVVGHQCHERLSQVSLTVEC